jgi:hypothetical protein
MRLEVKKTETRQLKVGTFCFYIFLCDAGLQTYRLPEFSDFNRLRKFSHKLQKISIRHEHFAGTTRSGQYGSVSPYKLAGAL